MATLPLPKAPASSSESPIAKQKEEHFEDLCFEGLSLTN